VARSRTGRTLITIPISHYCEKARWALERADLDYVEKQHIQVIHRLHALRAGGGKTVPVLVCPEGVFGESTEIMEYADRVGSAPSPLFPRDPDLAAQVRALEHDFDENLGPHGRRWMYRQMSDEYELVRDFGVANIPAWEQRALPVMWPVAKRVIDRILNITPETVQLSIERVEATFDEIGERLSDGRRYLIGDQFTAADLSFAALSAAVLVPREYGTPLPQPELLPEPMASKVLELRAHPAGEFALRLYREERTPKMSVVAA